MDETKNQTGDALPGKGQPSADGKGSTSPKTYTEVEVKKMVSDSLAEQGRKHKETTKSLEERLKTIETEKEARELEGVRGDPEKLSAYQIRKQNKEREEAIKAREEAAEQKDAERAEKDKRLEALDRKENIAEVVKDYEVDAGKLESFCTKYGLTTKEQITDAAETIGKKKEGPTISVQADSGVTSGGSQDLSKISFDANAPSASEMIAAGLRKKK